MKIRLNRLEFLNELAPMQGIVERRTTIPVLSHLLLESGDDRLELAATDLDVSLTSWCKAEVDGTGGIAVQARKFLEIIRAVVGEEVLLELTAENRLKIASGGSRFTINGLSAEDFPTLPEVDGDAPISLPFAGFKRMVGKVIFAVSTEESRFQLNGALVKLKDGGLEMVATDGHRLALVENAIEGAVEAEGVLVPRKALLELQRFEGDGSLEFRRSEHHLSFRLGRRDLICRILEGSFPDYERVIAKDNDKIGTFDRQLLSEAVQRVALLTGDRARAVRLEFAAGGTTVSAANPDLGEASETVVCEFEGESISLGINPDYLGHFLGAIETDKVMLQLKDENTQAVGVPVDGDDLRYLCVIMPMRV